MGDSLRPLWDFNDLDTSEVRFRAQLDEETTEAGRAEVLSQLARVEGLRANYERCDMLLDEAEALGGAQTRVLLERGRRARSSGQPGAGQAQFEQAFELARAQRRRRARGRCGAHGRDRRRHRGLDGARRRDRRVVRRPGRSLLARAALQQRGLVTVRSRQHRGRARGVRARARIARARRPSPLRSRVCSVRGRKGFARGRPCRRGRCGARAVRRLGGRRRRQRRVLPRGARRGLRRARA